MRTTIAASTDEAQCLHYQLARLVGFMIIDAHIEDGRWPVVVFQRVTPQPRSDGGLGGQIVTDDYPEFTMKFSAVSGHVEITKDGCAAPAPKGDEQLTYKQTAKLIGTTVNTVYSMVARRQIPHIRLGKRFVRFPRAELERWLQARLVAVERTKT